MHMRAIKQSFKFASLSLFLAILTSAFTISAVRSEDASTQSADEKAIRSQAEAFCKEFALGDAKAIAGMWTADGTLMESDGEKHSGRTEIQKAYTNFFKNGGRQPISISIESLTFPAPDVAVEQGTSRLIQSGAAGSVSRYSVVHVKKDGQWQMLQVTETPFMADTPHECLKELSWMIGQWTTTSKGKSVHIEFSWKANQNFIVGRFHNSDGTTDGDDIEVIGWDPRGEQLVSWFFGADGGFGHGTWNRTTNAWVVSTHGTHPDGSESMARYIVHKVSDTSFDWQSTNRTRDGVRLPDTAVVELARDTTKTQ